MRASLVALAAVLSMASPALASPVAPATEPTASIVYTADTRGLHSTTAHLGEPGPLYDPKVRGNVEPGGFTLDLGVLAAEGRFVLWGRDRELNAAAAKAALGGAGVRLTGPGRPLPTMRSDYATLIEEPADSPSWLLAWLAGKLAANGRYPDAELGEGAIFPAVGANGAPLWLVSLDGVRPGAAVLRDHRAWRWPIAHRLPVRRGDEERRLLAIGREFGGMRVHHEAAARRAALGAIRVDAGNLAPGVSDPAAAEELLDALPGMKIDVLVPNVFEIRLPYERMARLAKIVPLVAANLTPPPGIPVRPFVIHERAGRRIAIVGIVDDALLAQHGLVGRASGWKASPAGKALARATADARQSGADAVVVVTNMAEARLADGFLDAAEDVTAVITPARRRTELAFRERFLPEHPERARYRRPWLVVGAERGDVGVLTLGFPARPGARRPAWAENALRRHADDLPGAEDADAYWAKVEASSEREAAATDILLPDKRILAAREPRLAREDTGATAAYFDAADWSRLGASGLRRVARAEVGLVHSRTGGSTIIGGISRLYAQEWLPSVQAMTLELTGAQLMGLAAVDDAHRRFTWAGFEPERGLVNGRRIVPQEVYRVATIESVARSDDYAKVLGDAEPKYLGGTIRDLVVARFIELREEDPAFGPGYQQRLIADLLDDGGAFEPRWRLDMKPLQTSFQQFRVANRQPFGAVRNSLINAPDSTIFGGKGDVALTYEAAQIDWENRGQVGYQRAELQVPGQDEPQEQADNVQLTSEVRLKALKLQAPEAAISLVPFVSGSYLTEFTPTVDPATRAQNPRRRELNGISGLVLYPGGWLKEVRLGAIAKNDLAVQVGGFEPGVQLAAVLEQPLGPLTFAVEGDLKHYFLTPEDTADDLGVMGRVSAAVRVPIWGALGFSVGLDAFVFGGKVPETRTLGTSFTPTVGLTYRAAWKPQAGVVYGLGGGE